MVVEKQKFSKNQINKVGEILRAHNPSEEIYENARRDLSDWRELHLPIMNQYYEKCQKIVEDLGYKNVIVVQRLKRMPTILDKIKRYPEMDLSRLQDVAGVRIVVKDMNELRGVEKELLNLKPRIKNRIECPSDSGYRSEHFMFEEDGMIVEIQLRTYLQHLWATTVETVDIFRGTSLKTGETDDSWQDFFAMVSSIYAAMEQTPLPLRYRKIPLQKILEDLKKVSEKGNIFRQINGYSKARVLGKINIPREAFYVILTINPEKKHINCACYMKDAYSAAVDEYEKMEKYVKENSVLISVNDFKKVKEAYPNYFMNLEVFERLTRIILEEIK